MITIPDRIDHPQGETTTPIPRGEFRAELAPLYHRRWSPTTRKKMVHVLDKLGAIGIESTADLTIVLITP